MIMSEIFLYQLILNHKILFNMDSSALVNRKYTKKKVEVERDVCLNGVTIKRLQYKKSQESNQNKYEFNVNFSMHIQVCSMSIGSSCCHQDRPGPIIDILEGPLNKDFPV